MAGVSGQGMAVPGGHDDILPPREPGRGDVPVNECPECGREIKKRGALCKCGNWIPEEESPPTLGVSVGDTISTSDKVGDDEH